VTQALHQAAAKAQQQQQGGTVQFQGPAWTLLGGQRQQLQQHTALTWVLC
jgi:hypothetical protein